MADGQIAPEIIARYKKVAGATVYSAVRMLGYEPCFMRDVHAFTPGEMLVGRAKTASASAASIAMLTLIMMAFPFLSPAPTGRLAAQNGRDAALACKSRPFCRCADARRGLRGYLPVS